jgi:class 3 adenylate cyclase
MMDFGWQGQRHNLSAMLSSVSESIIEGISVAETDNAEHGLERKLATILSADVAAYSRLMAEDEEHTLRTFRGHKEVFEKLVEMHRGRVFNTAGDAILAEFGSAVEAVRCATEIQAALRTRNDHLPEDRQVKFRIGVNLGDVMVQGEDLLGDGVNVAARLQSAAEPGGICIAGSVYDQIRNKLSLSFKPLGEVSYKNIPQAVRTFAIAEAEGLGALPAPDTEENRKKYGFAMWPAIVAVVLLIAAGVGLRAYFDHRLRADSAREAQLTIERTAPQSAQPKAQLAAEKLPAEQAGHPADAEVHAAQTATPVPMRAAVAVLDPPRPVPVTSRPAETADPSGLYRGQICYGPGASNPAHCYEAQAVVLHHRISGEWPGRIPGATVYLSGHISPAGDVEIHMHSKRADGSRFAVIDMIGTLRDGRIDAAGDFLNGRHATLNWRKN